MNTLDEIAKNQGDMYLPDLYVVSDTTVVEKIIDNTMKNNYSYDNVDYPMPGQSVLFDTTDTIITDKEKAAQHLVSHAANMKLKKEQEEFNRKTDSEKIREYAISTAIKHQEDQYFMKYGFGLSGQQKRTMRRKIERDYAKGKYKLSALEKEEILYQLSLPSKQKYENDNNPMVSPNESVQTISSLMKGI